MSYSLIWDFDGGFITKNISPKIILDSPYEIALNSLRIQFTDQREVPERQSRAGIINTHNSNQIFIYCNLVDSSYSYVNASREQVLYTFDWDGPDKYTFIPTNLIFIPSHSTDINQVNIKITNKNGTPLKNISGMVWLLIKPCNHPPNK